MAAHVHPHLPGSHEHGHDAVPAGAEGLAERLRARGMRNTPQRGLVLAAVRSLGHATPDEISESVPGIDTTTVYRNLEVLEDLGFVRHAHLGHGAPSYRPAEDDHIHVVCHTCDRVIDAPPDLVDALAGRLHDERGFELDRSHFVVFGRCAACRDAADADSGEHPEHPAPAER